MVYSKYWLSSRIIAIALGFATLFLITGYQVLPNAHAATLTQAQIDSILNLIESFGADQSVLNNVNSALTGVPAVPSNAPEQRREINELRQELKSAINEFRRQLREGADNDEVLLLQEVLATDKDIYPEGLKTGYFGPLTKRAVTKFQLKHGVEGVGEVGPQTRRVLNAFLKKDKKFGTISNKLLTKYEESDDDNDNTNATSTDNGSGIVSGIEKVMLCHLPGGNVLKGHTLRIGAPALNAHLAHGDTLGECGEADDDDNNNGSGTTTVDVIAPIISNVTNEAAPTSADISWNTDEEGTSRVVYATSTPTGSSQGVMYVTDLALVTNHEINLSGLLASTTYYFIVSSTDVAGNVATSTEYQFTTQ